MLQEQIEKFAVLQQKKK